MERHRPKLGEKSQTAASGRATSRLRTGNSNDAHKRPRAKQSSRGGGAAPEAFARRRLR